MNFKQKMIRAAALAPLGFAAFSARAADVDVTAVAAAVAGSVGPITTISSGVLLVLVTLKVFHWVRSAIRG